MKTRNFCYLLTDWQSWRGGFSASPWACNKAESFHSDVNSTVCNLNGDVSRRSLAVKYFSRICVRSWVSFVALSPVHIGNNVEATFSKQNVEATFDFVERTTFQRKTRSTLLPFWQQSRTLLRPCCWCGRGCVVMWTVVGGGQLGHPCLPGDSCADSNAVCRLGVCLCHDNFFEKNTRCCTFTSLVFRLANIVASFFSNPTRTWKNYTRFCVVWVSADWLAGINRPHAADFQTFYFRTDGRRKLEGLNKAHTSPTDLDLQPWPSKI